MRQPLQSCVGLLVYMHGVDVFFGGGGGGVVWKMSMPC